MTEDQATQIKTYVKAFNSAIVDGDTLDLVVDTVADRVLLYLNTDTLDERFERIVAQAVVGVYKQISNDTSLDTEHSVKSVVDNGQHVTFSDAAKSYVATASDADVLSGFTELLAPYRRLHVNHTPVQGYNQ